MPDCLLKPRRHSLRAAAFALIVACLLFAWVVLAPATLNDADTLWHVITGNWILAHREVPQVDIFSFSMAGRPWVAHEWLAEVALALAYDGLAWSGLVILTALCSALTIGLVAYHARRHDQLDIAIMLVVFAVACGVPSVLARPHIIALPLVAVWTIGVVSARAERRAPSWWLMPVMTIWANLHGGYIVGLVVAGALAVEALSEAWADAASGVAASGVAASGVRDERRRTLVRWGGFLLAALAAATLTPHGVNGLLFPFELLSMHSLTRIQEWQPSDLAHLNGLSVAILIALYLGLTGQVRLPKLRVLMAVGLTFATIQHGRNGILFGVIGPILLADTLTMATAEPAWPLPRLLTGRLPWVGAVLAAAVSLAVRLSLPVQPAGNIFAAASIAAVPPALRVQPVLNEYSFGGTLIFNGIRPFIDGRADMYGDAFLANYIKLLKGDGKILDRTLCQYGIAWAIFAPDGAVPSLLERTPGWSRLYQDETTIVLRRDSPTPPCQTE